jgi:2-keto-3-deoxy-galactonokinase
MMDDHELNAGDDEDDLTPQPRSMLIRVIVVLGLLATAAGIIAAPWIQTPAPAPHATPATQK